MRSNKIAPIGTVRRHPLTFSEYFVWYFHVSSSSSSLSFDLGVGTLDTVLHTSAFLVAVIRTRSTGCIPRLFAFESSRAWSLSVKSKAFIWIEERAKHQIDCMGAMQQNAPGVSCEPFGRLSLKLLPCSCCCCCCWRCGHILCGRRVRTHRAVYVSSCGCCDAQLSTQHTVCLFSASFVTENYSYLVENKTLMNFMKINTQIK